MGRPRKNNVGLPEGIYFKNGSYHRVVAGKWGKIDTDQIPNLSPRYKAQILEYAMSALGRSRQNAKGRRGLEFALSMGDIHRMLDECGWRCAVTGAPFSMEIVKGKRPYAPSIDRIECSDGYLPGNCRLVCVAVNFALNVWGEDVLWRLFSRHEGLKRLKLLDKLQASD